MKHDFFPAQPSNNRLSFGVKETQCNPVLQDNAESTCVQARVACRTPCIAPVPCVGPWLPPPLVARMEPASPVEGERGTSLGGVDHLLINPLFSLVSL